MLPHIDLVLRFMRPDLSRREIRGTLVGLAVLLGSLVPAGVEAVPLLPWLGLPVLAAGLVLLGTFRGRVDDALLVPWSAVVLGAAFGAADIVGVGYYILPASLVVGVLLVLAQAADTLVKPGEESGA